jgi:hypothetical protein
MLSLAFMASTYQRFQGRAHHSTKPRNTGGLFDLAQCRRNRSLVAKFNLLAHLIRG